jgi:hypothetical protein
MFFTLNIPSTFNSKKQKLIFGCIMTAMSIICFLKINYHIFERLYIVSRSTINFFMEAVKKFKYSEFISSLKFNERAIECPPKNCRGINSTVFRWVFESLEEKDTFLPQILKPNIPRKHYKDEEQFCNDYALSLFKTFEDAIATFKSLNSTVREKIGYKNIAEGVVDVSDGVATSVEWNGHFNLHEYEGVDFTGRFTIIDKLPI